MWRPINASSVTDGAGITISRMGRDVLRYDDGKRHIDLTLESNWPEASVYTRENVAWHPSGEPLRPEERLVLETHITEGLRTLGIKVDFGLG